MKTNPSFLSSMILLAGIAVASSSYATTAPGTITAFDNINPEADFSIRYKSWSDPAFGDLGWTHTSKWGSFTAEAGQLVTLTMQADDAGIHPGSTVWFRGDDDTAADTYVPDHVYSENATQFKYGAVDETTGAAVGNIVMRYVIHGYDQDANTVKNKKLRGITDKVNGRLVFKFKAPYSGSYIFVVGGINPDPMIDPTVGHNVKVKVVVK
ncbi:MAG: copper(I)-binding protein CorA [Methylovulum sp.]|nr:copper(I)-binding protein CorA [Methylovulum sp.]MCF7999491.1 copper(I)-binding protein CorA [Methylovulum sp.]